MRWAVQTNLGNTAELERLVWSCREVGQPVERLVHIPFSEELPDLDAAISTVFYGATSFVTRVAEFGRWSPGVFFDPASFQFSAYRDALGERLLNAKAEFTTLAMLAQKDISLETMLFVRPQSDTKDFAGQVVPFGELRSWVRSLQSADTMLDPDCPIVAAEPVGLAVEWRLFVVAGEVVTGSQYRRHHQLSVSPRVPQEVLEFAREVTGVYSPATVFVLDIARSGAELYVVEYNCMNSAGFYASDTTALVRAIARLEEQQV